MDELKNEQTEYASFRSSLEYLHLDLPASRRVERACGARARAATQDAVTEEQIKDLLSLHLAAGGDLCRFECTHI